MSARAEGSKLHMVIVEEVMFRGMRLQPGQWLALLSWIPGSGLFCVELAYSPFVSGFSLATSASSHVPNAYKGAEVNELL